MSKDKWNDDFSSTTVRKWPASIRTRDARVLRRRRCRTILILTLSTLAGVACRDTRSVAGIAAPTTAIHALSHEDSLRRGYFAPTAATTSLADESCADCTAVVSVDPSWDQGYGQPSSISVALSGPVGFVRVSGYGSIQCSSGQYGTLIGYDSADVEIGRVNMQLRDPADCSPPDMPDDVTYGAAADLLTTRPMARVVITPMSPLEYYVLGECCGRAYAHYGIMTGKGNLGAINLTCSDPVIRGGTASCTASAADPTQPLVVTGWSYTSVDGDHVDRHQNTSSVTWQGRLAADGEVVVAGTVGGIQGQATPRQVAVIARDWQGRVPLKDHAIVSPSTLDSRPTEFHAQLGRTTLTLPLNMATMAQWSVTINDNGPNQGFLYLSDFPVTTTTRPQVNTNALNDTSGFYRVQESRQRTVGGVTYCARSFVLGIIPMIQAHEGYDPASQPNSHAGIFRHHVDSVAYRALESAAGLSDGPAVTSRVTSVFNEASNDSEAMDNDSRNNLNNVTVPCSFKYDYSKLK
jgi:hypothetical protein